MFRKEIRETIEASGLVITESKQLTLPKWALKKIYDDLPDKYCDAVFRQYAGMLIEAGLVSGENAVEKLLKVVGTELDPVDCAPGSIRFRLGGKKPFIVDGVRCYFNIIHRPRNEAEAEKDIAIFRLL
jgi:nucleoside diphosphate kinase